MGVIKSMCVYSMMIEDEEEFNVKEIIAESQEIG